MAAQSHELNDDGATYLFDGSPDQVSGSIENYFQGEDYKLEEGTAANGVYGTGNPVLRALLGALVKRYKFKVEVEQEGSGTRVRFSKAMSGAMGGVIGYAKMKKEYARIAKGLAQV